MHSTIKRIVIEVGGVEFSLSPEDALALQAALNELFPVKRETEYIPYPMPTTPAPLWPVYPQQPWITWTADTTGVAVRRDAIVLADSNARLLNQ